jgi:hypothetical protein
MKTNEDPWKKGKVSTLAYPNLLGTDLVVVVVAAAAAAACKLDDVIPIQCTLVSTDEMFCVPLIGIELIKDLRR